MIIEVLYFEGCPGHQPTVKLVRDVAGTLGLSLEVQEVAVSSPEQAEALRFLGSPSVRVNGRDIEPGADGRTDFALGCRIYGTTSLPPRHMLVTALRESQ